MTPSRSRSAPLRSGNPFAYGARLGSFEFSASTLPRGSAAVDQGTAFVSRKWDRSVAMSEWWPMKNGPGGFVVRAQTAATVEAAK